MRRNIAIAFFTACFCFSAYPATAAVNITGINREVSIFQVGAEVSSAAGLFDEAVIDAIGLADQNTWVTENGFSGTLDVALGSDSAPVASSGAISFLMVEFTLDDPYLMNVSVPLLTGEMVNPTGFNFPPGFAFGLEGPGPDTPLILFDNGGTPGFPPPFDSDDPVIDFNTSLNLVPGDYVFTTYALVTTSTDGGYGSGSIIFDVAFVPEPASLAVLFIGGVTMLRRR